MDCVIVFIVPAFITGLIMWFFRKCMLQTIDKIKEKGGRVDWGSYYFMLIMVFVASFFLLIILWGMFWTGLKEHNFVWSEFWKAIKNA